MYDFNSNENVLFVNFRSRGVSGSAYDMQVDRYDDSTLSKMQRQYWEAKQIFLKNIKKKEDDCIVAADADLDAKLEVRTLFC
jgi:hypothetical protein